MSETRKNNLPPCLILIDKEGRWYHEGVEMIHEGFIRLFFANMELDSEGRYIITWKGERCYVEVEDTAFVVQRVDFVKASSGERSGCTLHLNDGSTEALQPESLFVGKEDILYCQVKKGTFPARFNRPAYYQLAQYIEEEKGTYYLPLEGKKYAIRNGAE